MTFTYDCNGTIIKVWRSNNEDFTNCVTVEDNGRDYKRSIISDNKGKFFTWNKTKIYLDDFCKITLDSLKAKVDRDEFITEDELLQAILSEGVENVRFNVPMMVVDARAFGLVSVKNDERINKICHIKESFNRNVMDAYKITLVPDDYDETTLSHEDYYATDLVSCIRSGYIKIV